MKKHCYNLVGEPAPHDESEQVLRSDVGPRDVASDDSTSRPRIVERVAAPGEMGGVMFVVGPPADPLLRPRFDEYQAMKAAAMSGAAEIPLPQEVRQWEAYERALLLVLFDRQGEEPSAVEELLTVEHRSPVRLKGYELHFVRFHEHWLATVSIDFDQVETLHGKVLLWPPGKDALEAVAAVIGTALKREGVRIMTFGQALCPCAPSPTPDEGQQRPAVELDQHAFFGALLRTGNLLTAFDETARIDEERLNLLAETNELTPLEEIFQSPDDNYVCFEGPPNGPPPDAIGELLGGTAGCIMTFFFESGGPMCSTSRFYVAEDVCGYDVVFRQDEWSGYPLIGILRAGVDDSGQGLRSLVLGHLVHDEAAGFPPSSIENFGSRLSKEDLAAALYHRLEQCDGWYDFERQLALDIKYPILKPPEVMLQRTLAHLLETSDLAVSEKDDENTGMTEARKLQLVVLYFSRGQWYRDQAPQRKN